MPRCISIVLVAALLTPLVGLQCAFAEPASVITSEAIAAKQAEEANAKRELELMRDELAARVTEYVRVGKLIESTRSDISVVATQLAETDAALLRTEQAVLDRAVELYRGDRVGLFTLLFDARTIQDLMVRYNYLTIINRRDTELMETMRVMRAESAYLHESLRAREGYLVQLQERLDVQHEQIVAGIDAQQQKATALGADIAAMIRQKQLMQVTSGSAPRNDYDPDTLISDANYRDSASMSVDQIQAFLESQSGVLDTYTGPDHTGVPKSAA
ncbi:MAG: coiled-coil domain-containing protein, partial [Coriobacteriia bacterium]